MSSFSMASVRRVGVVGRYNTPGIAKPLARLAAFLSGRGLGVCMESETAAMTKLAASCETANLAELGRTVDLVIVVGGDGTMLSVARMLAPTTIPLIGINQGRLGFLTDIALADMESALSAMLEGDATLEDRIMLTARVVRDGHELFSSLAVNDVVVNRGGMGSMIELAVSIGDSYVCDLRADGVIIATPTGSTAYALSAHGPIVLPTLSAWSLVPISPHALTNRPIVIADDAPVRITITGGRDAAIHWDGHHHFELSVGDCIIVEAAGSTMRLLHPSSYDYFAMLRQKLHWSASPLGYQKPEIGSERSEGETRKSGVSRLKPKVQRQKSELGRQQPSDVAARKAGSAVRRRGTAKSG